MKPTKIIVFICFLTSLSNFNSFGQVTQDSIEFYVNQLKELMNITIVSASKKSESVFEAPFSVSVVTKEEIKKSGCTSILEALRLVPGIIVREQTNGNFDVNIRGLDNAPPYGFISNAVNTTTLVMIDNRPVYNYLQGGTFWETLPVDLNDVEKIEIVRGPASAIYGPNATTGVIQIITRKPEKEGVYALGNVTYGANNADLIANLSAGYRYSDLWSLMYTANMQELNRKTSYYNTVRGTYIDNIDSLLSSRSYMPILNSNQIYPQPSRSLDKLGNNVYLSFTPAEKVKFNLATGVEESHAQKIYIDNEYTIVNLAHSKTKYFNFTGDIYGLTAQVSYLKGTQNQGVGSSQNYDFSTLDALLEYAFSYKNLYIRPGLSYREAQYDDTKGKDVNAPQQSFLFRGNYKIQTKAFSLRTDYKMFNNKLHLTAGGRIDMFNVPDKSYLSYQLAANYTFAEKHLIRFVNSQANRSPFIMDNFANITAATIPIGSSTFMQYGVFGNRNLNLLVSNMSEVGYRLKASENLQIDMEAFYSKTQNYVTAVTGKSYMQPKETNMYIIIPLNITNLPVKVIEKGVTISANYATGKLQVKPFITIQQTHLKDFSKYSKTADADTTVFTKQNNINSGIGTTTTHHATPSYYGGLFANYQVSKKLNINLTGYYFGPYTFYTQNEIDNDNTADKFNGKVLLNAKILYKITKQLSVSCSVKNLLNREKREYYYGDPIARVLYLGISFEY